MQKLFKGLLLLSFVALPGLAIAGCGVFDPQKIPMSASSADSQGASSELFVGTLAKIPQPDAASLLGCSSSLLTFSNFEVNLNSFNLERVIVTGQRLDGWVTICRNADCADVVWGMRNAAMRLQQVGLKESAGKLLQKFFPNPVVIACMPKPSLLQPGDEAHPKNATSRSDENTRTRAAGDMIFSSRLYTNTLSVYEIDVLFSDGGTETYKYSPMNPTVPARVGNSLVEGDGISKCQ